MSLKSEIKKESAYCMAIVLIIIVFIIWALLTAMADYKPLYVSKVWSISDEYIGWVYKIDHQIPVYFERRTEWRPGIVKGE